MPQYMIVNEHDPDQCEAMDAGIPKLPPELRGKDFYCTCPGGVHGYFMILEGDSAEEILGRFPEEFRMGPTKALALEVFKL